MAPREAIPALIVLLFLISIVGLVFELLIAGASGQQADPAATGVLGVILSACVPGMIALYLRDSSNPRPPDPDESPEGKAARKMLRDYLDKTSQMVARWGF